MIGKHFCTKISSITSSNKALKLSCNVSNTYRAYGKGPQKNSKITTKSMERYTKKFLDGGMVEPKLIWHTAAGISKGATTKTLKFVYNKTTQRRINNLNQLFLDSITDIFASGVLGVNLADRQLTISSVRVLEDLAGIHVHWFHSTQKGPPDGEISTSELLKKAGPAIRQELVNQRVAGFIPPLTFIEDLQVFIMLEVEKTLRKLKLEDTKQKSAENALPKENTASVVVPDHIFDTNFEYTLDPGNRGHRAPSWTKKYHRLSTVSISDTKPQDSSADVYASNMSCRLTDNVFGVNRDRIMNKIVASLSRARSIGDNNSSTKNYPYAISESGPLGEPDNDEPSEISFTKKSSLSDWASKFSRYSSRGDHKSRKHGDKLEKDVRWHDVQDRIVDANIEEDWQQYWEENKYQDYEDVLEDHHESDDWR